MKRWRWDILNWDCCWTPSEGEEGGGSGRRNALPVMLPPAQKCPKLSPVQRGRAVQMSVGRKGRVEEIRQGAGRSRSPRRWKQYFPFLVLSEVLIQEQIRSHFRTNVHGNLARLSICIPTPTLTRPMAWSLAGTVFRTFCHRIHPGCTPPCTESNSCRSCISCRALYTWKQSMQCKNYQTAHPG